MKIVFLQALSTIYPGDGQHIDEIAKYITIFKTSCVNFLEKNQGLVIQKQINEASKETVTTGSLCFFVRRSDYMHE